MKTEEAIKKAGSRAALARILGIRPQATYIWKGTLPEGRVWQLRSVRPEWFDANSPESRAEVIRRADNAARIDQMLRMLDELKREVLAWRNS